MLSKFFLALLFAYFAVTSGHESSEDYVDRLLTQGTAEELEEFDPGLYDHLDEDKEKKEHQGSKAKTKTANQDSKKKMQEAAGLAVEAIASIAVGGSVLLAVIIALIRCCIQAVNAARIGVAWGDFLFESLQRFRAALIRARPRPAIIALPAP